MKETSKIQRFFNKGLKSGNNSHAWYNTYLIGSKLSENGVKELQDYINKNNKVYKIIIAHNVEGTRPQRTFGSMPSWARPESEWNSFDQNIHNNSFVLAIFEDILDYHKKNTQEELIEIQKEIPDYKDITEDIETVIKQFIESFPEKAELTVLSKEV